MGDQSKRQKERNGVIHKPDDNSPKWFVFCSATRAEKKATLGLIEAGFEAYCPEETKWVTHARKRIAVQRPLFSRYAFVRVDLSRQGFYDVRRVDGVDHIIGNQGTPIAVDQSHVTRLQTAQAAGLLDHTREPERQKWKAGQPVRVLSGPLQGFVGMVLKADQAKRVEILLTMLGSQRAVSVDAALLAGAES
jgi:transcriptional antiterminator RfaH